MKKITFCFLIGLLSSCNAVKITDKPIIFNEERKELTLAYLKEHYGMIQEIPTIDPKMIVVHWTAIPTLEKSFDAFYNAKLPSWRPDIKGASALNVSSQFLVDRDGSVYRLMPETTMARHVIGLNYCAIGIENVGGTKTTPLTEAQLKANIKLIHYLKKKYESITYLIGHSEYTLFENHPLWKELDQNYRTEKTDPGQAFMENLRIETHQYNWLPLPNKN